MECYGMLWMVSNFDSPSGEGEEVNNLFDVLVYTFQTLFVDRNPGCVLNSFTKQDPIIQPVTNTFETVEFRLSVFGSDVVVHGLVCLTPMEHFGGE